MPGRTSSSPGAKESSKPLSRPLQPQGRLGDPPPSPPAGLVNRDPGRQGRRGLWAARGRTVRSPAPGMVGIRPGPWMVEPFMCTMNFVFRRSGSFAIGTAGHCTRSIGQEVVLLTVAPGGSNPVLVDVGTVLARQNGGIGNDFDRSRDSGGPVRVTDLAAAGNLTHSDCRSQGAAGLPAEPWSTLGQPLRNALHTSSPGSRNSKAKSSRGRPLGLPSVGSAPLRRKSLPSPPRCPFVRPTDRTSASTRVSRMRRSRSSSQT
jgi:hypothetical protein